MIHEQGNDKILNGGAPADSGLLPPNQAISTACVEVALALPLYQTYTYLAPESAPVPDLPAKRVLVPFGPRRVTGYVMGPSKPPDQCALKPILDVLDDSPLFPPEMLSFFLWTAEYYMYPVGEVIKNALPTGLTLQDTARLSLTDKGRKALQERVAPEARRVVLKCLEQKPVPKHQMGRKLGRDVSHTLIRRLIAEGYVHEEIRLRGQRTLAQVEPVLSVARTDLPRDRFYERRKAVLDTLAAGGGELTRKALLKQAPGSDGLLKYLQKNGYIAARERPVYRDPFGMDIVSDTPPVLTEEQAAAVEILSRAMGKGFQSFLLAGVTGSGKTEVYLRIAAEAIQKGHTVLVLVPEIALISQTERRFRARFGEQIAVLHSSLSEGERFDQWMRIQRGEAPIVIGARSAVFAPLRRIGVIIVDEEHDGSYKQESSLRYNARDLAVVRAKKENCIALLGSATPSLQSSRNVDLRKFTEIQLRKRINRRPLPEITVVDLTRQRDQRGIHRFISPELKDAMQQTLARGEQVLLFLNRRGYANHPICVACGEPLRCKNCEITLTLHKHRNAYCCHFCGFSKAAVSACPNCGSPQMKALGFGTERIEAAARALFPDAVVARLDRDTTARKGALLKTLKALKERRIDILVGTQMVAKGHDFPNITLVGIVCADLTLNFPDFRSSEHTFQLLAQVAGRAGRGTQAGRVILQTYNPDHFSIQAAKNQDYQSFYDQEMRFRHGLRYPPFSRMVQLLITGKDPDAVAAAGSELGHECRALSRSDAVFAENVEILGPVKAPLAKLANRYRWQILLKGTSVGPLQQFVRRLFVNGVDAFTNRKKVHILIDIDPLHML